MLINILLLLATLSPTATVTALSTSCPAYTTRSGTTTGPLPLTSSTLTLTNTPSPNTLCTLHTTQSSLSGHQLFYIPVGRSYNGLPWERVAGKYSHLEYTCDSTSNTCSVELVDWESTDYYLTSYSYELTPAQTSARFFERASFGATASMLNLATNEADMASWISNQLDENVTPLTSHRRYFRKRLNPRMIQLAQGGKSGPGVCEGGSRWRNFGFTKKDYSE